MAPCQVLLLGKANLRQEAWPPQLFKQFSANEKSVIGVMWPDSFPLVGSTSYYVTLSLLKVDQPDWFPQRTSVYRPEMVGLS